MKRIILTAFLLSALAGPRPAAAHCQVPCGIFTDMLRIDMMMEDIQTIEKAAVAIEGLAGKTAPHDVNQVVRWIEVKDSHADHIGEVAAEYFLRQRIKAPASDEPAAQQRYVDQLKTLHALMVTSMKAKQTVDPALAGQLRELVERLKNLYFSEADLKHAAQH